MAENALVEAGFVVAAYIRVRAFDSVAE